MAIDTPIDVTPKFTASTVQFDSETVNVIVTSLLVVFILSNLGSAISKLVYFTRETSFEYESWLRAFIFANSDDPIRIISWAFGGYIYRERTWQRNPQRSRIRRAFIPLLSRFTILVASIASIAVTIPGDKRLSGCDGFDFAPVVNLSRAERKPFAESVCIDVPMESRRGDVRSAVAYCECLSGATLNVTDPLLYVAHNKTSGEARILVANNGTASGRIIYVEWQNGDANQDYFRSNLSNSISLEDMARVGLAAINFRRSCTEEGRSIVSTALRITLKCDTGGFNVTETSNEVVSYLRTALTWERRIQRETRIKLVRSSAQPTTECPIDVNISRPLVNIVPLAIALVIFFIINVIVSLSVRKHGNALDAGFHIIKETLGHDTTSNPLEEPRDQREEQHFELRKWICRGGTGHVGFIGRHRDIPVSEFGEGVVVGECTRAASELARARALIGDPVPGSESESSQALSQGILGIGVRNGQTGADA